MDALEDIIEKIKEYWKLNAEGESTQTEKNKKEVAATSEMRLQTLETFRESKKQKTLLALKLVKKLWRGREAVGQIP